MATITMVPRQEVQLSAIATLSSLAAPVVGIPQWSVDDPTKLALIPAPDGLTAIAKTKGPLGMVTVTVDAVGAAPISNTVDIDIVDPSTLLADAVVIGAEGPPADGNEVK